MYISGIGAALDKECRDKSIFKDLRRADNLSKMAVIAAQGAFFDSGLDNSAKENLGLILGTAFGPHVTTFRFLDDILNYGDAGVSPTLFSHSVHNAANAYIASNLGIRGPALTLTYFNASFYQALLVAESWLKEDRCEHILLGSAEEYGKEMAYVLSGVAPEFGLKDGSAFFLVSKKKITNGYSSISAIADQDAINGYILKGEDASGFACLEAAKMLREGAVKENKIYCIGKNINGERLAIRLEK